MSAEQLQTLLNRAATALETFDATTIPRGDLLARDIAELIVDLAKAAEDLEP